MPAVMAELLRWDSLLLPVIAGAALRLTWIDRLSIWLDEAFSVDTARLPMAQIWTVSGDVHPPLYYTLLHYWLRFGDSDAWIRMLSAVFGLLAIPVVFALGRALGGRSVGLAAAWLLALSPWHLWYSQEARMYAPLCLMGALSLLFGVLWLRRGSIAGAVGFVLSTLCGLYLDHAMLLLWPAEILLLLVLCREQLTWRRAGGWLLLQGAVVLGYLPIFPYLQAHVLRTINPSYIMARLGVESTFLLAGLLALAALAALAGLTWIYLRRRHPQTVHNLEVWALALVLPTSIIFMLQPAASTAKRMLLVLLPLGIVAAAWAFNRAPGRILNLRNALVLSLLGLVAMFATVQKEPWREVVAAVTPQVQSGDILLVEASWMHEAWNYYSRGTVELVGVDPNSLGAKLEEQLASHSRVWLILSQEGLVDPGGKVQRWLGERFALDESRSYYKITTEIYNNPAGSEARK